MTTTLTPRNERRSTMQKYTLDRTAREPIQFNGTQLVDVNSRELGAKPGKPNSHWWRIQIFQTDLPSAVQESTYVVAIEYHNEYQGMDHQHHSAQLTDWPAEALREFDPIVNMRLRPPLEQFRERTEHDKKLAIQTWGTLVSKALKPFPEEIDPEEGLLRSTKLQMFEEICIQGRTEYDFTPSQASLICDAMNGTLILDGCWKFLAMEIEDGISLNQLDDKWDVDGDKLLAIIRSLSPAALAAIAIDVGKFWRLTHLPTGEALVESGMVRSNHDETVLVANISDKHAIDLIRELSPRNDDASYRQAVTEIVEQTARRKQ